MYDTLYYGRKVLFYSSKAASIVVENWSKMYVFSSEGSSENVLDLISIFSGDLSDILAKVPYRIIILLNFNSKIFLDKNSVTHSFSRLIEMWVEITLNV